LSIADVPEEDKRRAESILREGRSHDSASPADEVVHLPFGVTLLARGWRDEELWTVAAEMQAQSGLGCGPQGHKV
jgi:allophanate hydrolase